MSLIEGGRRHFTHSKGMAWVAFDRAVKLVEDSGCSPDHNLARWKKLRAKIHHQVCQCGYNRKKKAFTQYYGSDEMDGSI